MKRVLAIASFGVTMVVATHTWAQPAAAPPTEAQMAEAEERYKRALELYNDAAYEQALLEFDRAYALAPAYKILYNVGQCAVLLKNYPRAVSAFEQFLEDGGSDITEERRAKVEEDLRSVAGRVAFIRVTVNVEGAEVSIDDDVVGTSPLEDSIMVNAGRHVVDVRKSGTIPQRRSVTLAGRDEQTLEFKLEAPSPQTPMVTPIPKAEQGQKEEPDYTWVGWVATGVLAAGAVGTGIGTAVATSSLEDETNTLGTSRDELDSKESTARALAATTDILIGLAAVSAGVTLYFQLNEGDAEDQTLGIRATPQSVALTGTF